MKQTNFSLLKKFDTMKVWMIEDTKRAMIDAKANFLVAQGLFAYTEIIGSFITGYGKENSGNNFDTFFERLGPKYNILLKKHNKRRLGQSSHIVYDDLRCGLLHEYTIKRKGFIIYNTNRILDDDEIRNTKVRWFDNGELLETSGVMYVKDSRNKGYWLIVDPIYWLDFKNAVDEYWRQICNEKNVELRRNFFKRARDINFKNFDV